MRFVERVRSETFHIRENFRRHIRGNPLGNAARNVAAVFNVAVNEFIFLRHQFVEVLFRHGAAHKIGLSQRIPRKVLENLHYLFLIHDNAVRIF